MMEDANRAIQRALRCLALWYTLTERSGVKEKV